jgi:RimJ/RimL family protein N-acetyltransferase
MHGPAPRLASDGFVLTPLAPADIPALVEACTEAEAVSSLNVPQPYTRADAEAHVRAAQTGDGGYFWAIRETDDGPLMGMVKLGFAALPGSVAASAAVPEADIGGIYLLPPHRSRGIATRAARLVAQWAFGRGFDTLKWECLASNTSSIAVAERIGFSFYGEGISSSQYEHHQNKVARWARMGRAELR